jgi:hypothetical protein
MKPYPRFTQEYLMDNPPAPFNPNFDPEAKNRYRCVSDSMERDGFYDTHNREECRIEWKLRYDNCP